MTKRALDLRQAHRLLSPGPVTLLSSGAQYCLEVQGENVEPLDFIGVQKITVA